MKGAFPVFCLLFHYLPSNSYAIEDNLPILPTKRAQNGIHLPFYQTFRKTLDKRADRGTDKLGDYFDVIYTVLLSIGTIVTPLKISTGTSDLWVFSDGCTTCNTSGAPFYPQATFQPAGFDVFIVFSGDDGVSNAVSGMAGRDTVGLAGIHIQNHYFASINTSSNSVGFAAAGVLGLGFPATSLVWSKLISDRVQTSKEKGYGDTVGDVIQGSYWDDAPLIVRLIANHFIEEPWFTVTLQRTTVELTGRTPGTLSIGELPEGVRNESLHWVPVRRYSVLEGGLPPPTPGLDENLPSYWEIIIDDVFFDGKRLPPSALAPSGLQTSAHVDMGTAFIRGPSDIISEIRAQMGGPDFPCSEPHTLAFKIGEVLFPVDPRDLVYSADHKSAAICNAFLADQVMPDIKVPGPRHSWVLGTAFLRGVVASFYYGHLQLPSRDPPRIGFLSRVPVNAGDLLKKAAEKGTLPYLTDDLIGAGSVAANFSSSVTPSSSPTASVSPKPGGTVGQAASRHWPRISCVLVIFAVHYCY